MIQTIDAICRSFIWTVCDKISKKSHVAWKQICTSKSSGGLNVLSLEDWHKANLAKLLWNFCGKRDN